MNRGSGEGHVAQSQRARMAAEQAVLCMDGRLRHKLRPHVKAGLIDAILKSDAQDDLMFRNTPARFVPPKWSLTGLIARAVLILRRTKPNAEDRGETLAQTHSHVRQSGATALLIALGVALFMGHTQLGEPLEIGVQALRDATRTTKASGDIVVIAKDDRSAKQLGALPWPRRYDAALIDKLREMGAKTIVMDDGFTAKSNPLDDAALAAAFDRADGEIWLNGVIEQDKATGKIYPDLPASMFQSRTQQGHFVYWYNLFGQIRYTPEYIEISRFSLRSLTEVLADKGRVSSDQTNDYEMRPRINAISKFFSPGELRPDFAIDFKTIPTISVIDIINGKVDRSAVAGKVIMIGKTDTGSASMSGIPRVGAVPSVYSLVIIAETIKNGIQRGMGYLPLLVGALIIGLVCAPKRSRRARFRVLASGTMMLIITAFAGDWFGLHFQIIPALFLLSIIGIREAMRSQQIAALTSNPVSGLPNISEIHYIKNRASSAIGALKVEQFGQLIEPLSIESQRVLINSIAARVNIMCPESVVHQGENGLFVWLIPPDAECDLDVVGGQLNALFMLQIVGLNGMHDVGVSLGIIKDISIKFDARLAVAIDRANVPVYVALREVL